MKTIIPSWLEKRIAYLENEKRRAENKLKQCKRKQRKENLEAIT